LCPITLCFTAKHHMCCTAAADLLLNGSCLLMQASTVAGTGKAGIMLLCACGKRSLATVELKILACSAAPEQLLSHSCAANQQLGQCADPCGCALLMLQALGVTLGMAAHLPLLNSTTQWASHWMSMVTFWWLRRW
jgi:hypothetical protein